MYHKHPVYDTDLHLVIDPVTRNINNTSGKTVLMQNDHNSERFTFEIPRYVDGHDMSLCNVTEVHYINIESANKDNQNADVYPVVDLQIHPDDENYVIGSWLVSQNATMFAGSLNAIFRFACVAEENSDITYQWFTNVFKELKISQGIYNTDVVTHDDDSDVLAAWKKEVYDLVKPMLEEVTEKHESTVASAEAAKVSEENAKQSEINAKASEDKVVGLTEDTLNAEKNAKESADIASSKCAEAVSSAIEAKSYAVGGTGYRIDEDTDNAKYYKECTDAIADEAMERLDETTNTVAEFEKKLENTSFSMDFQNGHLMYESPNYNFKVNEETGQLEWEVV